MNLERARELAAQAWCSAATAEIPMNTDLAEEFAEILLQHCGDSELVSAMAVLERTTETLASLIPNMPAEGKGLVGDLLNRTVKTSIELAKLIAARNKVDDESDGDEDPKPATVPAPETKAPETKARK